MTVGSCKLLGTNCMRLYCQLPEVHLTGFNIYGKNISDWDLSSKQVNEAKHKMMKHYPTPSSTIWAGFEGRSIRWTYRMGSWKVYRQLMKRSINILLGTHWRETMMYQGRSILVQRNWRMSRLLCLYNLCKVKDETRSVKMKKNRKSMWTRSTGCSDTTPRDIAVGTHEAYDRRGFQITLGMNWVRYIIA